MPLSPYPTYRDALAGQRLPCAFVDLDAFDENAAALSARAGSMPIRVASKSVRCVEILERLLAMPGYEGVMAFCAAEAAWLAKKLPAGTHILCAYPSVDPHDIGAVLDVLDERGGDHLALMVDGPAQVAALGAMAGARGVTLPLMLDVDMSLRLPGLHFGVRRSPVHDVRDALEVGRAVQRERHLRLVGVMGYEAQVAGLPDAVKGKRAMNAVIRTLKRASVRDLSRRRGAVVRALRDAGHAITIVNGGGTGSLETTSRDPSVTECTAGSGLYSPALFDEFRGFKHAPAAGFVLPVVRRPSADIVTCHGGGYVASGSAGADKLPTPMWPEGLELLGEEGAGEDDESPEASRAAGSVDSRQNGDPRHHR